MLTLKKTALFEEHKKYGGKLVEFAGFEMPVQYEGIIAEHNAVRNNAGIFDVSHMGEFIISKKDSLNFLNYLVPNNVLKIQNPGLGLYTQLCNERGGTVDDLIVYNLGEEFLIVVNASNIEKDWNWLNQNKSGYDIRLENVSDKFSLLALQGPKSSQYLSRVLKIDSKTLEQHKYFEIKKYDNCYVARTGYTGEDGFEIFIDNSIRAVSIWSEFIKIGVKPCGLGARDTLRLEAAYPLYGHELTDTISPLEAGLDFSVRLDKPVDFIGKNALIAQKTNGLQNKIACLKINDKLIARQEYKIFSADKKKIGAVLSGSQGITVGYPVATVYLQAQYCETSTEVFVQIRDKLVSAIVVKKPFYKRT